jgi:hypothetical protein
MKRALMVCRYFSQSSGLAHWVLDAEAAADADADVGAVVMIGGRSMVKGARRPAGGSSVSSISS